MSSNTRKMALVCALVFAPVGAVLSGCGQTATGTGTSSARDVLVIGQRSLSAAYVGQSYSASLDVRGGVGPYEVKVVTGTLPDGLTLRGSKLEGTPTTQGTYKFTVQATDANLSTKVQEYTLNVGDLPPLKLNLEVPSSEIRAGTRIPVTITAPRDARAVRLVWELPEGAEVTRVQTGPATALAAWKQTDNLVTLDMGLSRQPLADEQLALIWVQPRAGIKNVKLSDREIGFAALDGQGKLLAQELTRAEKDAQREAERAAKEAEQAQAEQEKAEQEKTEQEKAQGAQQKSQAEADKKAAGENATQEATPPTSAGAAAENSKESLKENLKENPSEGTVPKQTKDAPSPAPTEVAPTPTQPTPAPLPPSPKKDTP